MAEGDDDYIVERDKLLGYLLNLGHPRGKSKAEFFLALGFSRGRWSVLRSALQKVGKNGRLVEDVETQFGRKIVRVGEIVGPAGTNRLVRTVWIRTLSTVGWRLVTAYPDQGTDQ